MFANLSELFKSAVICVDVERHVKQVLSKAFDSPSYDSAFELERTPVRLVWQGGAADVQDGANRTSSWGWFRTAPKPSVLASVCS